MHGFVLMDVFFRPYAVAEALREVQLVAVQQGGTLATNQVEEAFGDQLNRLLDAFS